MEAVMTLIAALIVLLFGALVASAELMSRYRDAPARAVFLGPGLLYLAVNALAALASLALIEVFDWNFGIDPTNTTTLYVTRILLAGLGSARLLRTSRFTVHLGGQGIGIDPSVLLTAILKAVNSAIDRRRAAARLNTNVMSGISFEKHHAPLMEICTHAMQNLDSQDKKRLDALASALRSQSELPDRVKAEIFGLALMNLIGQDALEVAVKKVLANTDGTESSMGLGEHAAGHGKC